MDEDVKQILCRHRERLEKTVSSLKMKLAKSAEEHDKVYVKLMKVGGVPLWSQFWFKCLLIHHHLCRRT